MFSLVGVLMAWNAVLTSGLGRSDWCDPFACARRVLRRRDGLPLRGCCARPGGNPLPLRRTVVLVGLERGVTVGLIANSTVSLIHFAIICGACWFRHAFDDGQRVVNYLTTATP